MKNYSNKDDQDLLCLLSKGDDRAFNFLYERYWERLLYFAYQRTGDQHDAENVIQEVFVSLWKRRAELNIQGPFATYLMASVKYRLIRLLDQRRSRRLHEQQSLIGFELTDDSTQELLEFDELREQLQILISELPERSLLIFRLAKEQGLSHKQIAQELGTTEKAVNAELVRTKKMLRLSLRSFMSSLFL